MRRDSVVGIDVPPLAVREWRELCRYRHALVRVRTALINRLRAGLLRQGVSDARRLAKTRDDRWLRTLDLPPRAAASVQGLRAILATVRQTVQAVGAEVKQAAATDPVAVDLQQQ